MAKCTIPAHYPNQIDITRTPLAFGDRAVPRLVIKHTKILKFIKNKTFICVYNHRTGNYKTTHHF